MAGAILLVSCQPFKLNKQFKEKAPGADRFATAGSVKLTWDASIDATTSLPDSRVTGYYIYFGTETGVYSGRVDVGNQLSTEVKGLLTGTQYYFVATAYGTDVESAYSNEVYSLPAENKSLSMSKAPIAKIADADKTPSQSQNLKIDLQACSKAKGFYLYYGSDPKHLDYRLEYNANVARVRVLGLALGSHYQFLLVPWEQDKKVIADAKVKTLDIAISNGVTDQNATAVLSAVCE